MRKAYWREFSKPLIEDCDDNAKYIVATAKRVAYEKVFINERKLQIEIGAYSIIDRLLRAFCEAYVEAREYRPSFRSKHIFSLLGVNAPKPDEVPYRALMRITDFVAGCTDKYAAQLSQRLSGVAI
jgi:dGTPase